jgi:hypothetical protein
MATLYTYPDTYLAPFCNEDREGRATEEVEILEAVGGRTFDADWTEKLIILQTYIIVCIECQAQLDDLFDVKLKKYREEFDIQLARARDAADITADTVGPGVYSIPVVRL